MNNDTTRSIDVMMSETRSFPPSPDFVRHANATAALYSEAADNPEAWWTRQALERLTWDVTPTVGLEWNAPFATWFADGRLNAAVNCVDRHVAAGRGDRVAFHWVGEPEGDTVDITYADLLARVSRASNALRDLGVRTGDRVAIYMPMIPEAVVAMLACARLGAAHSVVFGGFSADALADRRSEEHTSELQSH